jgi:hypothetical protein
VFCIKSKFIPEQVTKTWTRSRWGKGGQRHAPAALHPGKRPGTHCRGDWVGPRAGLDGCGKPRQRRESIPGMPGRSESLQPTECGILAHSCPVYSDKSRCSLRYDFIRHTAPRQRLATGWTVRGSNPGGDDIFRTCPVRL